MRAPADQMRRIVLLSLLTTAFAVVGPAASLPWLKLDQAYSKDGGSEGGSSESSGHGSGGSGSGSSGSGSSGSSGSGSSGSSGSGSSGSSGSGSSGSSGSGSGSSSGPGSGEAEREVEPGGENRGKKTRQDAVQRYLKVLERHGKVSRVSGSGSRIDVRYTDGWRETISDGRYRLYDPNNRKIMDRAARRDDFQRLRAVRP